jgi:crotonobetainyl-CoA:carnitine CoA-transferase CaiB-like acyl-CoA transferase
MTDQGLAETLLGGYRVLDLTDDKGFLCGRILGDMGADVVKIETPGGDCSRDIGPYYGNEPNRERSLYWFAYNANKRGITLDIESEQGKELFKKLVATADIVVESFAPGHLDFLGLGYDALAEINPGLILTSITPFGQTGPYRDFVGSDLVVSALSGSMFIMGDPDRAPVRVSFPQTYIHAGSVAAGGSVSALFHRELTGEGQQVDVAAQHARVAFQVYADAYWDTYKFSAPRLGPLVPQPSGRWSSPYNVECKDGYVCLGFGGGSMHAATNIGMTEALAEEGLASDFLKNMDWRKFDASAPECDQEYMDQMIKPYCEYIHRHTKRELHDLALAKHMLLTPLADINDVVDSEQLAARGFWVAVEHPELGETLTYPGPFVNPSETEMTIRRRAPLIGEHNAEIYLDELGLSRAALTDLEQAGLV